MDNPTFLRARTFLCRNARPLDYARFRYHFEGGPLQAVLTALAAYQNEDGGFGHALEPDSWNPNSSPLQTWAATEVLRETGFTDAGHPIIKGILRYLASGQDFDGRIWQTTVVTNNDYPHARWWSFETGESQHNRYNPTACLAGFIVRFADPGGDLFRLGCRVAQEAFRACISETSASLTGMHALNCYIGMFDYMKKTSAIGIKIPDVFDIDGLETKLKQRVKDCISRDTETWNIGYVCKPSQFIDHRDSIYYPENKKFADYECDYIAESQLEDGSWPIPWKWAGYPQEWAISQNWWKGNGAVKNLLYLKGMGRLNAGVPSGGGDGQHLIRHIHDPHEKKRIARAILFALPDWFGIPEQTEKYIESSAELPFWASFCNSEPTGFVALATTSDSTAEIHVMGVLPQHHRRGIGRRLFSALYDYCKREGYRFLQVKTVDAGRYDQYDRTRLFYEGLGFSRLEVFPTLWDERNPCLVMVMAVK